MVTVAVRRVNILDKKPILTDYLNPKLFYYQIQQVVITQKKF